MTSDYREIFELIWCKGSLAKFNFKDVAEIERWIKGSWPEELMDDLRYNPSSSYSTVYHWHYKG